MANRYRISLGAALATVVVLMLVAACSSKPGRAEPMATSRCDAPPASRILEANEGERRVRRPPPTAAGRALGLFVIKGDCQNGGSPDLFFAYEDIPPGLQIRPHHHPHMDEILIIRQGSGLATLSGREARVTAGATIYIPRDTTVSLRNTGAEPLSIAWVFPNNSYGDYLREGSVKEGEPVTPFTAEEYAGRRARFAWLQMIEPQ